MNLLGIRIKQLRKQRGLTQTELGSLVNVTKVSICCYENGTRMPSLETLMDLSQVFNVSVDFLLGLDNTIISEGKEEYNIRMANEEIVFIKELRKYGAMHDRIIANPKRLVELMLKKLK